jgi:hypothetical protein
VSHLKTFSTEELIALANLMAFSFAEEFDTDDLNVLGNWVTAVGAIMLTIAAQQQLLDTKSQEQPDVHQQIKELQEQLKALQKQAVT